LGVGIDIAEKTVADANYFSIVIVTLMQLTIPRLHGENKR
jgi:hypothetical protein